MNQLSHSIAKLSGSILSGEKIKSFYPFLKQPKSFHPTVSSEQTNTFLVISHSILSGEQTKSVHPFLKQINSFHPFW